MVRNKSVSSHTFVPKPSWRQTFIYLTGQPPFGIRKCHIWAQSACCTGSKGRFTLWWRRPPVGQECLAKTWLYEANGGCAGEEKGNKIFLLSWASPEAGQETPPPQKPNSKKCRLQVIFIIHEKSSPPLFSSPSVNTHRSRVAFSTNHNCEKRPFFHDRWTSPP